MSETKLLPCPFCGGEARIYEPKRSRFVYRRHNSPLYQTRDTLSGEYIAQCKDSSCNGHIARRYKTPESAANAWNSRKPMERIVKRLENENMTAVDLANLTCSTYQDGVVSGIERSLEIVKEEGGLSET